MSIREYLAGITAAALICALVKSILPGKALASAVTKLMLGLLMTVAVFRPFGAVKLEGILDGVNTFSNQAQLIVGDAQKDVIDSLSMRIKQETESYILSKAQSLGAELEVDVTLSDDPLPVPIKVLLQGSISPYAKTILKQMITEELGIDGGAQEWNG